MEQHQYSCTPFKMWKNLGGQNIKKKTFRVQNISGVKNMEKKTLWFTMA